jgi:hypothetical protein
MNSQIKSTATIIANDFSQLETYSTDSLNDALKLMIETTVANGYKTFLIPSNNISSWQSSLIINNPKLTFVWCIVYYYERMLWEHSEDIGALKLTQQADQVLDLNFEESDHPFQIYRWFIDNSRYILFLWDGQFPSVISSLIGYAQVTGKNGLIYDCSKQNLFNLLTPDMIPPLLQDQYYDPDFHLS